MKKKYSLSYVLFFFLPSYFKNAKSVLFHPEGGDSREALTRVLSTGFAGCVHFSGNTNCDIKVLILLYSPEKKSYLGFIPNDQVIAYSLADMYFPFFILVILFTSFCLIFRFNLSIALEKSFSSRRLNRLNTCRSSNNSRNSNSSSSNSSSK